MKLSQIMAGAFLVASAAAFAGGKPTTVTSPAGSEAKQVEVKQVESKEVIATTQAAAKKLNHKQAKESCLKDDANLKGKALSACIKAKRA
jgi:hypothetical protein